MRSKTVAIIGAGPCGLAAAKYSLENGLIPFVFDKANEIGGLWQPGTATWEGLHSNVSKHIVCYADHPWSKGQSFFPSKKEIHAYLKSYADRFQLNQHIQLNKGVNRVKKLTVGQSTKWQLEFENDEIRTFDFLICASGLHSKPHIPEFKNIDSFEGLILHSSQFQLNMPELKDKKVIVIGFSQSGSEQASLLVNHAQEVVNIFKRPYLLTQRLVHVSKENGKWSILPVDFFNFRRRLACFDRHPDSSSEQCRSCAKGLLQMINPQQTNKDIIHPDLFVDLDDPTKGKKLVLIIELVI
jgi:dimethylaniline monooxygenase (N-oxide forming)